MSVPELLQSVAASSARDVVLTGGEPMLSEELAELTQGIRRLGRRITVETAGTVDQPVTCDLMAISPKLSNSVPVDAVWSSRHERTRHQPDVVRALCRRYDAILKFVIDHPDDVAEVGRYLMEFPAMSAGQVWLMPQARDAHELADKSDWIRKMAEASGYRFSPRLHIERFGNRRGV